LGKTVADFPYACAAAAAPLPTLPFIARIPSIEHINFDLDHNVELVVIGKG